jgi:hypothetical protein
MVLDLSAITLGKVSVTELQVAVKWPDDPTAEVAGSSIAKFGTKMLGACAKYRDGINNGLLCNSHYGTLQFFHAMASVDGEPTGDTQQKVLEWASFLYGVASGKIPVEQSYCEYFSRETTKIATYLRPQDFFACTAAKPWTIRTLFSFKCKNPLSSTTCTEKLDSRTARVNALGALLHVVQDSYAEGHTARGNCAESQNAKLRISQVACNPIRQFHSYNLQDSGKHRLADAAPVWGTTCSTATQVEDPILSSAKVLWHVQHGTPLEDFQNYIKNHIFALDPMASARTGAGDCFEK